MSAAASVNQLLCRPTKSLSYFIVVSAVTFFCALYYSMFQLPANHSSLNGYSNEEETLTMFTSSSDVDSITLANFLPTKNILLWTNSYGYRFGVGRQPFVDNGCRVSNCLITYHSTLMAHSQFDAFLVHPPTINGPYVLQNRRPDQMFVLFSTEPPVHMYHLQKYEDYFNWTISYRTGSTFRLNYGEIVALESAPQTEQQLATLRMRAAVSSLQHNPAKGKTKLMAIWMVTNCKARSNRQGYVRALRKHLAAAAAAAGAENQTSSSSLLDIFSRDGCEGGRNICPREKNGQECYDTIERDYKFYLSFENSICDDYVTEKFFEIMSRNVVAVVLGGVNYTALAPPHSFINALDFTPRQLADYLKRLDGDDRLYAEYFWWKPHYRVANLHHTNRQVFCDLCQALHYRVPLLLLTNQDNSSSSSNGSSTSSEMSKSGTRTTRTASTTQSSTRLSRRFNNQLLKES